LSTYRQTAFLQNIMNFSNDSSEYCLTYGLREHYWGFNNQLLISPRLSFSLKPNWEHDFLFRFASGYYYQPPFYKEVRNLNGQINEGVLAQKSIHFVLGTDYVFTAWDRKFKLVAELYYKYFDKLIPYQIDNVRIRYYATNNAKGYATGIDVKVNGEFVPGLESWVSMSIMKTMEDINNDFFYTSVDGQQVLVHPGYIPRPTDQLVNFGLFFQDYLPRNPSYKMQLSWLFGSGLPFGPPNSERYKAVYRMPSYRRVDIGFSKSIISEGHDLHQKNIFRHFKSLWVAVDVFNLLGINNTISYEWISDISNHQYAVPNYLTSRRLDVKIMAKF
jgi:hypothetical protein